MENTKNTIGKKLWSTRGTSWFPVEAFSQDVAILNDGTLAAVLEVIPLDMALMAREEAEAVLGRFWQAIKGVPFPLAIYLGRRRQDMAAYLKQADERLVDLAKKGGQQEDFYGRLLEEHLRLVQGLLRDHLRSRYTLLAVPHGSFGGLSQAAGLLLRKKGASSGKKVKLDQEQLQRGLADLHMKVKKVEDLLRRVGLKYVRYTGIQLAAEVARLCRPDLAYGDIAAIEKEMGSPPIVTGAMEERIYARAASLEA